MPLYVRDETVNELAEQARKILKVPTKTEAIRQALERVVGEKASEPPLEEKLMQLREKYKLLGRDNPDFDNKAFIDEMWEI